MQQDDEKSLKSTTRPRLARTRFVGINSAHQVAGPLPTTDNLALDRPGTVADQPTTVTTKLRLPSAFFKKNWNAPVEDQHLVHLLQLSGMMRAVRAPGNSTAPLPTPSTSATKAALEEDGSWPLGIQQAGPLPIRNLYGREPFGRTLPRAIPLILADGTAQTRQSQPLWRKVMREPAFKISLGLLLGLILLFLVSRFIDLPQTLLLLQAHLLTPPGIGLALLAGLVFLSSHALRSLRWRLFLTPIARMRILSMLEISQVAAFLNFLLPMRAGEAAKGLALKRLAALPISRSLPTVALDKALDFLPAPLILALLPVLGVRIDMDLQLWLLFGLGCAALFCLLLLLGLTAWRRAVTIHLLRISFRPLPRTIGTKGEGFVTGLLDALLEGASRPVIFLPALGLTGLAALCDGLFVLLAFQAIGFPISFSASLVGAAIVSFFSLLPTPPGQVGSYEIVGLLVFGGLLSLPANDVIAMTLFSHIWLALLLAATGPACLKALELNIFKATHAPEAK